MGHVEREPESSASRLLGEWRLVRDEGGIDRGESITAAFTAGTELVYVIVNGDKQEVIKLVYEVDGETLMTNQPSKSREERTRFWFDSDGFLVLVYGGRRSWFQHVGLG